MWMLPLSLQVNRKSDDDDNDDDDDEDDDDDDDYDDGCVQFQRRKSPLQKLRDWFNSGFIQKATEVVSLDRNGGKSTKHIALLNDWVSCLGSASQMANSAYPACLSKSLWYLCGLALRIWTSF